MLGKPVRIDIVEVRQPDLSAQLVAENVASQLERRISFRRAMKMAIRNTMRLGAKGIKVSAAAGSVAPRLPGRSTITKAQYTAYPARRHRLRVRRSQTTYGKIGVKVWIYRGEVIADNPAGHKPARAPRRGRGRRPRQGDDPVIAATAAQPALTELLEKGARNRFESRRSQIVV